MKYQYYPGCSLEATALEYNVSTRAVMDALGAELVEIEDWTCCGASAAESTSYLLSLALPARNLALAERSRDIPDILVPCSACYLNLKKVTEKSGRDPGLLHQLNTILEEDQLALSGGVRVKHLLEVMSRDIGAEKVEALVKNNLGNLSIAPYYGCQCLRPYAVFDDPEKPCSMEPLIKATGAEIHEWDAGGRCCGASHMNTKMKLGLTLVTSILEASRGADAIVTVCPMCQMNLEAHQRKISKTRHSDLGISILYLPQLIGTAMGLPEEKLRLDLNLSITRDFKRKLRENVKEMAA